MDKATPLSEDFPPATEVRAGRALGSETLGGSLVLGGTGWERGPCSSWDRNEKEEGSGGLNRNGGEETEEQGKNVQSW